MNFTLVFLDLGLDVGKPGLRILAGLGFAIFRRSSWILDLKFLTIYNFHAAFRQNFCRYLIQT